MAIHGDPIQASGKPKLSDISTEEMSSVEMCENLLIGVAMDRHGLILWENEATGSRKVFRYLLDLRDAIFLLKMVPDTRESENPDVYRIF